VVERHRPSSCMRTSGGLCEGPRQLRVRNPAISGHIPHMCENGPLKSNVEVEFRLFGDFKSSIYAAIRASFLTVSTIFRFRSFGGIRPHSRQNF
jgi:hypothetical protein